MKETKTNIWDTYIFTGKEKKSAMQYLNEQKDSFIEKTAGELDMCVEATSSTHNNKYVTLYLLKIIAHKLGGYGKRVLTVCEYNDIGRFPVDIFVHFTFDGKGNKDYLKVSEDEFIKIVSEIIATPIVKTSIESLYSQSKEIK